MTGLAPRSSFRARPPRPRLLSPAAREWLTAGIAGFAFAALLIEALIELPLLLPHGFLP